VSDLEFQILGPVEVLRAGKPIAVGGSTTLRLLTGLLLNPNHTTPVSRLAEWAWPAEPPVHPRAALHNAMSRLRRLIGVETIDTLEWGYRLRAEADNHDLLRFERLHATARDALASGQPETALSHLDEAVRLWHEPLLGNVESAALAHDVLPRLTERYLGAIEERAELRLQLGRHEVLVDELPALIRAHPFRERLVGQLMITFARSGRRVDALVAYDVLQHSLNADLGIDPGPALRDLRTRILRDDPDLVF
jgi:DNA-binding SARP family transcriptional activator